MDREKVISDLQEQIDWIRDNEFHKFPGWGHTVLAMKDALELLKEQEAVEPEWKSGIPFCGNCGHRLQKKNRNAVGTKCPLCGRSVKWNA